MSQAEELLNRLSTTAPDNEEYIVIDDDRFITVPESLRRLGVQHDHNIETVTLECPRFWDGHDMSQMKIYINYLRPDGIRGSYLTGNLKVHGNRMTFDWIISNNVTYAKGKLSFLICIVKTNDDGLEIQHWNSELNQECYISEGMECAETIVLGYPDIITHLLLRMDQVETTASPETVERLANTWLEENHDRLLAEIEAKAQESLDTIPPDYTEVYTLAHDSVRTRANAIVPTAAGEVITVTDSSDDYLRGLKIFGKTTQTTTTGKNLVDLSDLEFSDSNYVHSFGSNNSSANALYEFLKANTGKNIVISMTISGVASGVDIGNIRYYGEGDALICSILPGVMHTIIELPDTFHACYIYGSTNGASIKNLQVEFGETATEYEPYSGRVTSPSPEWSQELMNLSNPKVSIVGKNLIDMTASAYYDSGVIKTAYSSYNSIAGGFKKIRVYPGHTYTFSYKLVNGGDRLILVLLDINGNPLNNIDIGWGEYLAAYNGRYGAVGDGATFTIPAHSKVVYAEVHLCQMNTCGEGNYNIYADLQFEEGSSATEYEPYKTPQTFEVTRSIPGVPVSQNGNYTDFNGQQWICDEVDFERGVYVQRVGVQTFTNAFEYLNVSSVDGSGVFYCGLSGYDPTDYNLGMMSTHFRFTGYDTHNAAAVGRLSAGEFSYIRNPTAGARLYFAVAGVTSKAEATVWLADNVPVVYYPLKTPVELSLTADELEAFKWYHTNQPNTTIMNDTDAYMELRYNADTQEYLESVFRPTDAQVQAAVNAWLEQHFANAEEVSY